MTVILNGAVQGTPDQSTTINGSPFGPTEIDNYTTITAAARTQFATDIKNIVGDANVVRLIIPARGDTTTTTDLSRNAATCTWDATIAARLSQQGLGYNQTFASASAQKGSLPDANDLSFNTGGLTDLPFSIVVLANVTDTAGFRTLVAKSSVVANVREYYLQVENLDRLQLVLGDASVGVFPNAFTSATVTQGSLHLQMATYSGVGGATAASGILLYEDAVSKALVVSNAATYVAMENDTNTLAIGSQSNGANYMDGTQAMTLLTSNVLTQAQLTAIKTAVNKYFGLSL